LPLAIGAWRAGDARAAPKHHFGDRVGNAYALDAVTGRGAWTRELDTHPSAAPTGTPTLSGHTLYVAVSSFKEMTAENGDSSPRQRHNRPRRNNNRQHRADRAAKNSDRQLGLR
jgi:outer membrane protein assembly factor BamB